MKLVQLGIPLILMIAFTALAAVHGSRKPDFSGEWTFVAGKSRMQIPVPSSGVFRVDHREPDFHLSRTLVNEGKSDTWDIDLTSDGKEVVKEEGEQTTRVRLCWDSGGKDLIFNAQIILKDREAAEVVRYHLSDDGMTLTATEVFRGPIVKYENVWVFEKKR